MSSHYTVEFAFGRDLHSPGEGRCEQGRQTARDVRRGYGRRHDLWMMLARVRAVSSLTRMQSKTELIGVTLSLLSCRCHLNLRLKTFYLVPSVPVTTASTRRDGRGEHDLVVDTWTGHLHWIRIHPRLRLRHSLYSV